LLADPDNSSIRPRYDGPCEFLNFQTIRRQADLPKSPFAHKPLVDHALADTSIPPPIPTFTSISFSNDGLYILVGTSSNFHYIVDAFDLELVRRLGGHQGLGQDGGRGRSGEEVSWTGDSKWVISGSNDGTIVIWEISAPEGQEKMTAGDFRPTAPQGVFPRPPTLEPAVRLQSGGPGSVPSRAVRFSPKYGMMASGGDSLVSISGAPGFRGLDTDSLDILATRKRRTDVNRRGILGCNVVLHTNQTQRYSSCHAVSAFKARLEERSTALHGSDGTMIYASDYC
jgi:WD40 repeat protein